MWSRITAFIAKEVMGFSLKTWLYVVLAFLITGEQAWVFNAGVRHERAKTTALTIKAQATLQQQQDAAAKKAVESAASTANELNKITNNAKQNEANANEIANSITRPADCQLTDDERMFLKQLVESANSETK